MYVTVLHVLRNDRYFANDIFKYIVVDENLVFWLSFH